MIRHYLSVILLLLTVTAAHAQIPVLTSTSNPAIGDFYIAYTTDTFAPGPGGAALTWNFDTLNQYGTDTDHVAACSASPHCSDFPGTGIYIYDSQNPGTSTYFTTSATAVSLVGAYNSVPIPYDNYEDQLRFPCSYDSVFTDTFSANLTTGGYTYRRTGTVTVRADAYGTLILPTATYTNPSVMSLSVTDEVMVVRLMPSQPLRVRPLTCRISDRSSCRWPPVSVPAR